MKTSVIKGTSFGLTSGVITTLGLMVGLYSGTNSKFVVLGGILTIAVADAFSDALGIHISEESEGKHSEKEIWVSTIFTIISKFIFSALFLIPVFFLNLQLAIIISVIWGLALIGILSYYIALWQKVTPWKVISEHIIITLVVITLSNFVGKIATVVFGNV